MFRLLISCFAWEDAVVGSGMPRLVPFLVFMLDFDVFLLLLLI